MVTGREQFDTNVFFSGGAGMFLQYHDVIKPVYLYAIFKMIIMKTSFGLPLDIIENMSVFSLTEWYVKRRYKNPLISLDFAHILDPKELDDLLFSILQSDDSLYRLSPGLNIQAMMDVYRKQRMSFPIYIYSEVEEPNILIDCKEIFSGIDIKYLHGDLKSAIKKCDQNFTYILSDIELVKELANILNGTYSHILLAEEYRYNYIDDCKTTKYDLLDMSRSHPYIRIGLSPVLDMRRLALSFEGTISQEVNF